MSVFLAIAAIAGLWDRGWGPSRHHGTNSAGAGTGHLGFHRQDTVKPEERGDSGVQVPPPSEDSGQSPARLVSSWPRSGFPAQRKSGNSAPAPSREVPGGIKWFTESPTRRVFSGYLSAGWAWISTETATSLPRVIPLASRTFAPEIWLGFLGHPPAFLVSPGLHLA